MKTVILRLASSLSVLVLLAITSYSQPKDLPGWHEARWGMSEREIVSAFGSRVTRLPERKLFARWHVDYVIPNFKIDRHNYTVFFQMDDRTNKLTQVLIRLNEMESRVPRDGIFSRVHLLLTRNYGSPAGMTEERWSKSPIKSIHLSRKWAFLTTTVELYYGWDSQIYASLLTITYSPSKQQRDDERRITGGSTKSEMAVIRKIGG